MGNTRRRTPEQVAIGRRMRAAALEADLGVTKVARHLGVHYPTVHRWWTGERAPSSEMMRAYAALVEKPIGHFYGEDEGKAPPREVAEILLGWAERLMDGTEAATAFDRATGEPAELTPAERETLTTLADPMRDDLTRLSGGAWALLSEEERREVLEQIARLAARRRPPDEPPS